MNGSDPFGDVSTMRLYGGAVGVVSGAYSVWLSTTGMGTMSAMDALGAAGLLMVLVGLVALVHGVALFTPAARSVGRASGPLMLGYAVVMLLLQAWAALSAPTGGGMAGPDGMDGGMDGMNGGMGGMDGAMAAGADPGMVALALLMLFSGVVMTLRRGMLD